MHVVEDPRIFGNIVYTDHVQESIFALCFVLSTDTW